MEFSRRGNVGIVLEIFIRKVFSIGCVCGRRRSNFVEIVGLELSFL